MNKGTRTRLMGWLDAQPDGPLRTRSNGPHKISLHKCGSLLTLRFFAPNTLEIQSAIDVRNPLRLLVRYLEGMLLGLLWRENPLRIHIVGFGGGRLPFVLRHYFPEVFIDCTDIDSDVVEIAKSYFGFLPDSRMQIVVQDGRDYLEKRPTDVPYDIIMVDAFRGVGFSPFRLATTEFFETCKRQLNDRGVLVLNLLESDALLPEKLQTLARAFRNVHLFRADGSLVVFADNTAKFDRADFTRRAESLERTLSFAFPFSTRVAELTLFAESRLALGKSPALRDSMSSRFLRIDDRILAHIRRNDSCPCGSGRKFKRCHGCG